MNYLILTIVIAVIFILLFASWNTVKPKLKNYIMNKIMDSVHVDSNPAELNIDSSKKYAKLDYFYSGSKYTLYIPFDKKLLRKINTNVYHQLDGKIVDITHQQGIPILITPNMLGGGTIIVKKEDEVIKTFEGDSLIQY